jgi:hypothetical protein
MSAETARLFKAKEQRRQRLAALPFPQKVEAVIRLQQMAAPILCARGKLVRPWKIVDSSAE